MNIYDKRWIELQTINAIWYVVLSTKNLPYADSYFLWIQLSSIFFVCNILFSWKDAVYSFLFAIIKWKHFIP